LSKGSFSTSSLISIADKDLLTSLELSSNSRNRGGGREGKSGIISSLEKSIYTISAFGLAFGGGPILIKLVVKLALRLVESILSN
jgi:hypothetical protein